MTFYLSGPMSSYDDFNFPAFSYATKQLRSRGYSLVSPHENAQNTALTGTWQEYLKADLKEMLDCDAIVLLPGWEKSRGATFELFVATTVGLEVNYFNQWAGSLKLAGDNAPMPTTGA